MYRQSITRKIANLIIGLCSLVALPAIAAVNVDLSKDIQINAAQSSSNLKAKVLQYQDNVTIEQGSLKIFADKASVETDLTTDVKSYILLGTPVKFSQLMRDGSPVTAEAGKVTYQPQFNLVTVTDGAKIQLKQSSFTGDSIRYDIKTELLIASGKPVQFNRKLTDGTPINIEAREIRYDPEQHLVSVDGNAIVRQEGTEARGSKITYNIKTEQLDMTSASDRPVTTIIQPKSTKKKTPL